MSRARYAELSETRLRRPQAIAEAAAARRRPSSVADLGPVMVIAADHTARGMLGVKGRPLAMADLTSYDLLVDILGILAREGRGTAADSAAASASAAGQAASDANKAAAAAKDAAGAATEAAKEAAKK